MYMPHHYINLLLNQALPPHRAWEVVMAAVTADNAETAYALLLDDQLSMLQLRMKTCYDTMESSSHAAYQSSTPT